MKIGSDQSDNGYWAHTFAGGHSGGAAYLYDNKANNGLSESKISLNRKILSDLAINDASTFEKIVKTAVK